MSTLPIVPPRLPSLRRARFVALGGALAAVPLLLVTAVVNQTSRVAAPVCARPVAAGPPVAPADVVTLQVDALRANEALGQDRGIRVAWQLASAGNRAHTGPFPRFAMMVKGPLYAPLLAHDGARYGPVDVSGEVAQQRVVIEHDGVWLAYRWTLTRSPDGRWRTDAVMPEPLE